MELQLNYPLGKRNCKAEDNISMGRLRRICPSDCPAVEGLPPLVVKKRKKGAKFHSTGWGTVPVRPPGCIPPNWWEGKEELGTEFPRQ